MRLVCHYFVSFALGQFGIPVQELLDSMYTTVVWGPGLDALVARLSGGYSASSNRWSSCLRRMERR